MEDVGTSKEEDTNSQDSNVPVGHDHLARNYLIKIITPAVKALVISYTYIACNILMKNNIVPSYNNYHEFLIKTNLNQLLRYQY